MAEQGKGWAKDGSDWLEESGLLDFSDMTDLPTPIEVTDKRMLEAHRQESDPEYMRTGAANAFFAQLFGCYGPYRVRVHPSGCIWFLHSKTEYGDVPVSPAIQDEAAAHAICSAINRLIGEEE